MEDIHQKQDTGNPQSVCQTEKQTKKNDESSHFLEGTKMFKTREGSTEECLYLC